jgi:hypothetical protein
MSEKSARMRAERAEYALERITEELDGMLDSMDDRVTQDDFYEAILLVWRMAASPQRTHIKGDHDGIPVCLTCPKNSIGYAVAWEHLHEG